MKAANRHNYRNIGGNTRGCKSSVCEQKTARPIAQLRSKQQRYGNRSLRGIKKSHVKRNPNISDHLDLMRILVTERPPYSNFWTRRHRQER